MNKKLCAILFALLCVGATASAEIGFRAGVGVDFLNYSNYFLTPELSVMPVIGQDLELELGLGFGIYTRDGYAHFQLPIKAGFNFLFPVVPAITPYLSIGVLPQFVWSEARLVQPTLFLIGPYLGAGVRFQLHPLMSVFVEAQQTLLIGEPLWINTGTRVGVGLQFKLDASPGPAPLIPNQAATKQE